MNCRTKSARRAARPVWEPLEGRRYMAGNAAAPMVTFDLRIAGGGKAATVVNIGDVVQLELWALVRNLDGNRANDGFELLHTSLVSLEPSLPGVMGNLGLPTLNTAVVSMSTSSRGTQNNLDAHGDLEVGG